MADKHIGALPAAFAIYDDSLFVAEQQGKAVKIAGRQLRDLFQGGSGSNYTGGGFIEMSTSIATSDRVDNTLYGLILESYN